STTSTRVAPPSVHRREVRLDLRATAPPPWTISMMPIVSSFARRCRQLMQAHRQLHASCRHRKPVVAGAEVIPCQLAHRSVVRAGAYDDLPHVADESQGAVERGPDREPVQLCSAAHARAVCGDEVALRVNGAGRAVEYACRGVDLSGARRATRDLR